MRKILEVSLALPEPSALALSRLVFLRAPEFWARTGAIAARSFLLEPDLIAGARFFRWRMTFLPGIVSMPFGDAGAGWEACVTVFS